MRADHGAGFRLAVLNPGGRDPEQKFSVLPAPDSASHAPVNFHAYAACTGGTFFRDTASAIASQLPVLLLLRGDFREARRALHSLQAAGRTVAVSLKETGLHQVAEQLSDPARLRRFTEIIQQAGGCIAPTPEASDIYRHARRTAEGVAFIPTPYPLHDSRWDFSLPLEERSGIFVGTREWDVPSRNHAAALFAARQISDATDVRVTIYNADGRKAERLVSQIGFPPNRVRVLNRRVRYPEYLRVVAEHKIVLQMDTSFVPGQVAGDALLCRLPCVGGNGAVDRLGHPSTCGYGRTGGELVELAVRLLRDAHFYEETGAESQRAGQEHLSFADVTEQLARFFAQMARRPTAAA